MKPAWSLNLDRVLAAGLGERPGRGHGLVARGDGADQLDERHHRRGVEEVHAAHQLGAAGLHRHLDHRKGRRVRREDRALLHDAVELAEEVLLGGEVLDDGLDHEVALGEAPEVGDRAHPAEDGGALGVVELAAVDLLGQRLLEARHHRVGGGLRPAPQHDLVPGLPGNLGDAAAHDP